MKNILIFLAILLILMPFAVILQNIMGWNLVSNSECFFLVAAFIILFTLYKNDQRQKNKDTD